MAQRVSITLVDDLDGSEATGTVTFGLDGTTYEIDLNDEHASTFREMLGTYVTSARAVPAPGQRRRPRSVASKTTNGGTKVTGSIVRPKPEVVRKWALENGIEVGTTGRVPSSVYERYAEAMAS